VKPSLVLDASAVAKWFVEGMSPGRYRVRDLYLEGAVTIYVPSLLFTELANALRYVDGLDATDVINAVEAPGKPTPKSSQRPRGLR